MNRSASFSIACLIAVGLAACSGGGGGGGGTGGPLPGVSASSAPSGSPSSSPSSRPSSAPSGGASMSPSSAPSSPASSKPYTLPSAAPANLSSYAVSSVPATQPVTLDGAPAGSTPVTLTPAYAKTTHAVAVVPSGGASPYVVTVTQTANGPHAILYNRNIDTAGTIASVATNSVRRRNARAVPSVAGPRKPAVTLAHRPRFDAAHVVVRYDLARMHARTFAAIEGRVGTRGATTFAQSSASVTRVVALAPGASVDAAMRALAADPAVASVDRLRLRYPLAASSGPVYPNDTFYTAGRQWYLDAIDAVDAWGYGLGSASVPIAVIDTGYDPQQPEVAAMVTFSERIGGGTVVFNPGAATDTDGHGTYVSGIAAAQTNNGAGFAGVSWGASLQEYKVYDDGAAPVTTSADVAEGIREAVAHGAKVILAAVGGEADAGPDPLERDAVAYALAQGVTVVAGAGNEGDATLDYPAGYDGVIAVGASAVNDTATPGSYVGAGNFEYVPTYSNGGGAVALVAPGGDPAGASDTDGIHYITNAYTTQPFAGNATCAAGMAPAACAIASSGTSAAAAEVAGAAALVLARTAATPAQIAAVLENSADDIGDPRQGRGRLNLHAALARLLDDTAAVPALQPPAFGTFVAFAYANAGGTKPQILDVTYPRGAPVSATGTFRIADVPASAQGTYKIAVWADTNGNGIVDAGDYFGAVARTCAASGACAGAGGIAVAHVTAGFTLP